MKMNTLLLKDGGDIISIIKLKESFSPSYIEYLSKQVAEDFRKYIKENDDFEFDTIYDIIEKYEKVDVITTIDGYVIDLDNEKVKDIINKIKEVE